MLLTVKKFTITLLLVILTVTYSVFINDYLDQREKIATVMLKSIKSNMIEVSYIISKNISNKKEITKHRAILDRTSANNNYLSAILIVDNEDVLLTTDPHYSSVPLTKEIFYDKTLLAYDTLVNKKGIEGEIRFYKGKELSTLKIIFLFDKDEIKLHLNETKTDYLINFGLLPIFILLFALIILRYFILTPLEKLRQFAYYQTDIPEVLKLKELEAIRSSMAQTFARLNDEQKELYKMARTDILSGLANRNALDEYIERLIADSVYKNTKFAFLFLDIDHFKTVNDELGHIIGDELLKSVSSKIKKVIPENDFVARVGGDEFVIVLHKNNSILELTKIIDTIQKTINNEWIIDGNSINISSSIGIAFYPKDAQDMTSLMQHSSMAMYEAKKKGRARYHFFTDELNTKVQDTIALDKAMHQALIDNEYELYYQPKVNVQTGAIVGAEALIRWISPTKGIIPPDVFIPLAEENGFIVELGDWVLQEAVYQQVKWKEMGIDIIISINVATKQILNPNFEYKFRTLLYKSKVDTSKIDVEITEYLFLENNKKNLEILHFIHKNGVTISLDDFGTGYSSLSYLKKFPIDTLKIDKVFLDDYNTPKGGVFVETIVKMGQTLNMIIVAEGVETKEQVEYLKGIDCSMYQGYYCSKPLPVKDFEKLYQEK